MPKGRERKCDAMRRSRGVRAVAENGRQWQRMAGFPGSGNAAGDAPPRTPLPRGARRTNAGKRFPPEVLTDGEVRRLLDACGTLPSGVRNRALLILLYRAGLRVSEALALRPKDLDLAAGSVRVLFAKGGRSRTVGIDPGGAAVVAEWLAVREGLGLGGDEAVFCSAWGSPITSACVRRLMPVLARKAGVEKRVHAHGFRHTHAAQLREEGLDIGVISKQLGHRSIATTALYLDHVAPVAVVRAIGGRRWE